MLFNVFISLPLSLHSLVNKLCKYQMKPTCSCMMSCMAFIDKAIRLDEHQHLVSLHDCIYAQLLELHCFGHL